MLGYLIIQIIFSLKFLSSLFCFIFIIILLLNFFIKICKIKLITILFIFNLSLFIFIGIFFFYYFIYILGIFILIPIADPTDVENLNLFIIPNEIIKLEMYHKFMWWDILRSNGHFYFTLEIIPARGYWQSLIWENQTMFAWGTMIYSGIFQYLNMILINLWTFVDNISYIYNFSQLYNWIIIICSFLKIILNNFNNFTVVFFNSIMWVSTFIISLYIFLIMLILVLIRGGAPRFKIEQLAYFSFNALIPTMVGFLILTIFLLLLL